MSTSTSEKGHCEWCGHPMAEHTSKRSSRCKLCRKRFIICQAGKHGHEDRIDVPNRGWRICFRPCTCPMAHWPDHAHGVTSLQPWEHKQDHPGYGPYERPSEEDAVGDLTNRVEGLRVQAEPPVFVEEPYWKGKYVCFRHNNVEHQTRPEDWRWIQAKEEGCYMVCQIDGVTFSVWELPAVFVEEPYWKGNNICFYHDDAEHKTRAEDWSWTQPADGKRYMDCQREGVTFCVWELPTKGTPVPVEIYRQGSRMCFLHNNVEHKTRLCQWSCIQPEEGRCYMVCEIEGVRFSGWELPNVVFVQTSRRGASICFSHGHREYKTALKDWDRVKPPQGKGYLACRCENFTFWVWELPGEDVDEDHDNGSATKTERDKRKKGKGSKGKEKAI